IVPNCHPRLPVRAKRTPCVFPPTTQTLLAEDAAITPSSSPELSQVFRIFAGRRTCCQERPAQCSRTGACLLAEVTVCPEAQGSPPLTAAMLLISAEPLARAAVAA